jgi:hypothetical protein
MRSAKLRIELIGARRNSSTCLRCGSRWGCCAVFAFGSALSTWFLSRTARLEQEPDWMETIPWNTMHTLFR